MKKIIIIWVIIVLFTISSYGEDDFTLLVDHGSIILMIDPATGDILFANISASKFYGYDINTLLEMNINQINTLNNLQIQGEMELAKLEKRNYFQFEHRLSDDTIRYVDVYSNPIEYEGKLVLLSIIVDQTDAINRIEAYQANEIKLSNLNKISLIVLLSMLIVSVSLGLLLYRSKVETSKLKKFDLLTKVYNSTSIKEIYDEYVKHGKFPIAFYVLDMNNLKLVNDVFGRSVGNDLILKAAKSLKGIKYRDAQVARISGGEFVIVLPNCGQASTTAFENELSKRMYRYNGLDFNMSVGSYLVHTKDETYDSVFSASENNMFYSKIENRQQMNDRIERELMKQLFALDVKYKRLSEFSVPVSSYIAKSLELKKEEVEHIEIAASVQNIGMPTLNSDDNFEQHCENGFLILSALGKPMEVSYAVYSHHESFDGSGYPQGLSSRKIPLIARILSVVNDIYDVWEKERDYKKAIQVVMTANTGKYDSEILRIIKSKFFIDFLNQLEV